MVNLEDVCIEKDHNGAPVALRLDWDNDRHHYVKLSELHPMNIELAFLQAAKLINSDARSGKL